MSKIELRKTFSSGSRRLFERNLTECNAKSFTKTMYYNNIFFLSNSSALVERNFKEKDNYKITIFRRVRKIAKSDY
jgi:hypothetical protein